MQKTDSYVVAKYATTDEPLKQVSTDWRRVAGGKGADS